MTRDLVERARRGDHDAFAELAGAAISRLDATAWLMLRDADRATDAVQNALVRAWRDLPTLRDPDRFDAWLRRLLVNACIDEIRRVRRRHLDVDITDLSTLLPSPTPRRRSPTATSSSEPSAGSSPRSGRSSSCITTSTCRCRRSRRRSGSRWARPSPACTAGSGRCGRRSTPTLAPGPTSERGARHEPQRRLRPPVSDWLHADAEHRVPEHLDAVLRRTRTERQRPAWSSLERWLPVQTDTSLHAGPEDRLATGRPRPGPRGRGDRRSWIGTRQRLPPPFGPARNGAIVIERMTATSMPLDPVTGARTPLIGGHDASTSARPSRATGRSSLFLRGGPTDATAGLRSDPRGRQRRRDRGPRGDPGQPGLDWLDWSPDGTQIAFLPASREGHRPCINVVNVDGSGLTRSTSAARPDFLSWLPPTDARSCSAANRTTGDPPPGIFAVQPGRDGPSRAVARARRRSERLQDMAVAPDGTQVALPVDR